MQLIQTFQNVIEPLAPLSHPHSSPRKRFALLAEIVPGQCVELSKISLVHSFVHEPFTMSFVKSFLQRCAGNGSCASLFLLRRNPRSACGRKRDIEKYFRHTKLCSRRRLLSASVVGSFSASGKLDHEKMYASLTVSGPMVRIHNCASRQQDVFSRQWLA